MGDGEVVLNQATKENVAWKSDEPTPFVKEAFSKGLIKPGEKVLDIGSGFGRNSNWLAAQGVEVSAVNIDNEELNTATSKAKALGVNVDYIEASATQLPLPEATFDVVLDLGCSHMLDGESQTVAEKEVARVVKPGGYLIYFGFSKEHPVFRDKPESPMFRNVDDLQKIYGDDFEVVSVDTTRWKPMPDEKANFTEHVGLNMVMKRKSG